MRHGLDYAAMLAVAVAEARMGLAEGGIPIGAAIFDASGQLIAAGHNRRVQHDDPSMHGETDAFRKAGRQRSYRELIMVTTLAPCWYCSGLVRQFGFRTLVVGESPNFQGGLAWLRSKLRLSPTTSVRNPNCRTSPLQYQQGASVVTMISSR